MNQVEEAKASSRGVSRDMSPEAISRRFDILVELDRAARALGAARKRPNESPRPAMNAATPAHAARKRASSERVDE